MAVDYWRRLEPYKGMFSVEIVAALYTALTSVAIVLLWGVLDDPLRMIGGRLVIVAVMAALMAVYRRYPCKATAFVRVAFQLALLSYWYPDTFEFNKLLPNLDHVFASAEQAVVGTQPAYWFSRVCPQLWVSELLNMGYFAYYPMIATIVVWHFLFNFKIFEKTAFVLEVSFFVLYVIYILVPVAGPQFYFPVIGDDSVLSGVFPAVGDYFRYHPELLPSANTGEGFFYGLVEHSQAVGERPTAAFPSSHVGISTIIMIMAWRDSRRLFAVMLPFYVLLCLATVYIQAHYLIDVFAGLASAAVLYVVSTRVYKRWFNRPDLLRRWL